KDGGIGIFLLVVQPGAYEPPASFLPDLMKQKYEIHRDWRAAREARNVTPTGFVPPIATVEDTTFEKASQRIDEHIKDVLSTDPSMARSPSCIEDVCSTLKDIALIYFDQGDDQEDVSRKIDVLLPPLVDHPQADGHLSNCVSQDPAQVLNWLRETSIDAIRRTLETDPADV
ncbi:MAG: hypothetical protein AAF492_07950, partial [Verrucomicrobiota bacterium]